MDIFEHLPLPGFVVRIKVFLSWSKGEKGPWIPGFLGLPWYESSWTHSDYSVRAQCVKLHRGERWAVAIFAKCRVSARGWEDLGGRFASRLVQFLGPWGASRQTRQTSFRLGSLVGGLNPLKNISQLGWLFPIYGKIKNDPNHQPENDGLFIFLKAAHLSKKCADWYTRKLSILLSQATQESNKNPMWMTIVFNSIPRVNWVNVKD